MDPDAELMKHLTVLMDRAKASVRRSTVPLFTADKDRTVRLPLGSAVLLSVADVDFLVSAAHVTDTQFRDGEVVGIGGAITGDDRIVPLEWTSLLSSPLPATGVRQHDMVDVSVVRLPASLSAHLRGTGRQFLRLMDLAKLGDIGSQPQFLLAGYPGVLTSEEPNQETVRSTLFAHGLLLRRPHLAKAARSQGSTFSQVLGLPPARCAPRRVARERGCSSEIAWTPRIAPG